MSESESIDKTIPEPVDFTRHPSKDYRIIASLLRENIELKHAIEEAVHDPLTGLRQRKRFIEDANRIRERAAGPRAEIKHQLAVMMFDANGLKQINDSLGHDAGDDFLCVVADEISGNLRPSDVTGRLGGDEFGAVFIITAELNETRVDLLGRELRDRMNASIAEKGWGDNRLSAGITLWQEAEELTSALARADSLMYENKRQLSE